MLQFLDHERPSAFADDEPIALRVERATRDRRIAFPLAHRLDNRERPEGERTERCFGTACHHFTGAMRIEWRCIETGDARNAAAFGADAVPELLSTNADAGDRSEASDNGATLHCCSSTYAFMQRNVLFATG